MSGVRVGDSGTEIIIRLIDGRGSPVNISEASAKQVVLVKPNGDKIVREADFYSDGLDGILKYVSNQGDFDIPGKWKIQAVVSLPSGSWSSSISIFTIDANL